MSKLNWEKLKRNEMPTENDGRYDYAPHGRLRTGLWPRPYRSRAIPPWLRAKNGELFRMAITRQDRPTIVRIVSTGGKFACETPTYRWPDRFLTELDAMNFVNQRQQDLRKEQKRRHFNALG